MIVPRVILAHNFVDLKVLDVSGNALNDLEGSLFTHLPSLKILNACNNNIKKISNKKGFCTCLREFSLDSNLLRNLPSELGKLNKLEKLNLARNKLSEIPVFFKNLSYLEILNLKRNSIRSIPDGILSELSLLTSLHLLSNPLTVLTSDFKYL